MAQAEAGTVSGEQAPVDLEEKIARDVMVIFQKQMDSEAASEEASAYIWQNAGTPEKIDAFADLMRPLGLNEMARTGIAALARGSV